ncbi:sensor histidine kinase [Streptomyces sp. NPDC012888]|uniref:sensor histidine kinase n=1 Tax=Streptomyces sp. NPDC012888 TaxID=3364855 RepID=UPI0036CBC652
MSHEIRSARPFHRPSRSLRPPPWAARLARMPGPVFTAVSAAAAGLSATSLWWAPPALAAGFLAGSRPGRARGIAFALVTVAAAAVVATVLVPAWMSGASRFVAVLVGFALVPWFAGRFHRQYRELVRAGWERAERMEREQRLVAERARLRERARIAQDMHDALGHELSLIALSAGALQLAPGLPDALRPAARDVRARAGAAAERLGEVVGLLRQDPAELPARPAGAGIADLVAQAAASGLDVRLRTEGEPDPDTPGVTEQAAYRVVQEALTNVAKHAPGTRTVVELRYGARHTGVRVANGPAPAPARPAARPAGTGSGLVGLDERVRLAGGRFTAGPATGSADGSADGAPNGTPSGTPSGTPNGSAPTGFVVRAELPHRPPPPGGAQAPARSAPYGTPATGLPPEHRTASRRLRRTALAAVMVPLLTTALLVVGVRVWDTATARQSVLDPRDFAALRPGTSRAALAPVLPERQTTLRPARPRPVPPGAECAYYVQTADPFDDRSGDLFRLCFRDGLLLSTDTYSGKDVR